MNEVGPDGPGPPMDATDRGSLSHWKRAVRRQIGALLPRSIRDPIKKGLASPSVRWGNLRRLQPFSRSWGFDRGLPIDRVYIEAFLKECADDIKGTVLEVQDSRYTRLFGGERVARAEVLDIDPHNHNATIVADLNAANNLPDDSFDCIILTQTLQLIFEVRSALKDLHRSLKPGGVLLVTVPGITKTQIKLEDTWYWCFTATSMQRLLDELFGEGQTRVTKYGNLLTAVAFLEGLAASELSEDELAATDPEYQVIVAARSVKPVA